MLITSTWQQISVVGAVVQKQGTNPLTLQYSASTPTGSGISFAVTKNDAEVYPAIATKALWAIATRGDVTVAVEELST